MYFLVKFQTCSPPVGNPHSLTTYFQGLWGVTQFNEAVAVVKCPTFQGKVSKEMDIATLCSSLSPKVYGACRYRISVNVSASVLFFFHGQRKKYRAGVCSFNAL
jgi:hypothetical protein